MWLDSFWVLGLAENLEEIVVGQEVESREDLAFGLQVHVEGFLDLFQLVVHVIQLLQKTWMRNMELLL